jgi:DNA-binding transcriptional MerR regulator
VLRYWEREFRSIRPTKSAKGQRVYSRKDVENLLRVRDLLYRDGFTIAGAKKKLTSGVAGDAAPLSSVNAIAESETEVEAESAPEIEPVMSAPPSSAARSTREKLVALRDEVESFLDELSRR